MQAGRSNLRFMALPLNAKILGPQRIADGCLEAFERYLIIFAQADFMHTSR